MKAVIWTRYGPGENLEIQEVPTPQPGPMEVLVQVKASSVTAGDCEIRTNKLPLLFRLPVRLYNGISRPKRLAILGQEYSGIIAEKGENVSGFEVGDEVFGTTGFGLGAYAEFLVAAPGHPESTLIHKPAEWSFEEAAVVPTGGLEAQRFLIKAGIQPGQTVLIYGSGGSIGTMGVQIAKSMGAEVTAVDHGDKLPLLKDLGADHVIDYTQGDVYGSGKLYDIVFDIVGKSHFLRSLRHINKGGWYLIANPTLTKMIRGAFATRLRGKRVSCAVSNAKRDDIKRLRQTIIDTQIRIPIDKTYAMSETAEAHSYVESGAKQGNVAIAIGAQ